MVTPAAREALGHLELQQRGSTAPATALASTAAAAGTPPAGMAAAAAALRELPAVEFSHIYAIGQREIDDKGVPEASQWAAKFACGARSKPEEIVDTKAGYVYDTHVRIRPILPGGFRRGPGKAQVYRYAGCKDGIVVADVVRLEKGHTEGLEPKVTEELVKLMLSAKGEKSRRHLNIYHLSFVICHLLFLVWYKVGFLHHRSDCS